MGWNGGARGRADGGKVDGGADRTTRELEGPKETTRVEPRRWPKEKERVERKRDERRTAADGIRDACGEAGDGVRSTGGS